jgi:aldehyde dehydrogenase (NAD+)
VTKFTEVSKALAAATGDPFAEGMQNGPQASQSHFDVGPFQLLLVSYSLIQYQTIKRIMGYIESGKQEGATLLLGGERVGTEGYFIQPTVFTDTTPEMKIVKEEIFGPVAALIKFTTEEGQHSSGFVIWEYPDI